MAQDRPREFGEEALDEIEPRTMLGREKVNSKRPGGRASSQALVSLDMCAE